MRSRRFFERLLGVEKPWEVSEVELQRGKSALDGYFGEIGEAACARIKVVTMDMWAAYIGPVKARTNAAVVFAMPPPRM